MAELSTEDRQRIWRGLMRLWSRRGPYRQEAVDADQNQLMTTVIETDQWVDGNQVSYNSALTYAALFTTLQKSFILCAVVIARVSIDLLRRLLGRVD